MKNRLVKLAFSLHGALALLALTACATSNNSTATAPAPSQPTSVPEAASNVRAAPITVDLKPLFKIAAPAGAVLDSFSFYLDQDRGDTFYAASMAANKIFALGTEQGELFGEITGTAKTKLLSPKFIREADNQFFVLGKENSMQVLSVDFTARSDADLKLTDVSSSVAMAVAKKPEGYAVAIVDQTPSGKQLKLFDAVNSEYSGYRKNDLNIVKFKLDMALPMQDSGSLVVSTSKESPGFVLAQGNEARFSDISGAIDETRTLKASGDILAIDAMVCNRGSDPGYFIVAQQDAAGQAQLEVLGRKDLQLRGTVRLEGVKQISDLSFVARPTVAMPSGGVYMIADGQFVAVDWQKIADALRIRRVCF